MLTYAGRGCQTPGAQPLSFLSGPLASSLYSSVGLDKLSSLTEPQFSHQQNGDYVSITEWFCVYTCTGYQVAVTPQSLLDLHQSPMEREGENGSRCPFPCLHLLWFPLPALDFPRRLLVKEFGNHSWDWGIVNSHLDTEKLLIIGSYHLLARVGAQFQHNGWARRRWAVGIYPEHTRARQRRSHRGHLCHVVVKILCCLPGEVCKLGRIQSHHVH